MKSPEIIVGRDFAVFQHAQEMFRAGFNQLPVTNRVKRLVHDSAFRAGPVAAGFYFDKINHDFPPGAPDKILIRSRQICLGDLKVDGRLFGGLVFRVQQTVGRHPVIGVQTFLFARPFIVDVISSAILAAIESELLFHGCCSQR